MELEELRIGNYILGIFEDENEDGETIESKEICQVVALDSVDLTEYRIWVESEKSQREHWDNLIGIPLTEEWLIDFGFKETHFGMNLDMFHIDTEDRLMVVDASGYGIIIARNVIYVHQIQNIIFDLAGKELKRG